MSEHFGDGLVALVSLAVIAVGIGLILLPFFSARDNGWPSRYWAHPVVGWTTVALMWAAGLGTLVFGIQLFGELLAR